MNTDVTPSFLEEIKDGIEHRKVSFLKSQVREMHPADIARLLKELRMDDARYLFLLLGQAKASDVLVELEEGIRKSFLSGYQAEEIVDRFVTGMDSDDAADFINELPEDLRLEVIGYLNKRKSKEDREVVSLLKYEEDSAGGLMAKELIRVNINWTVSECISEIRRQAEDIESIFAVYVEDNDHFLKGFIPLKSLILCPADKEIGKLYDENVIAVEEDTPAEEVADIMGKYDLVALPVIDKEGKLVGRITIDDVVDFIREEAEEDYQLMSGISEDVEYSDKVWRLSRARLPWLLLGLLGGVASAKVISLHEGALKIYPEMAFFIPLIAAMGGNAGVQSSAIVVQGIASRTIQTGSFFKKIFKEFLVAVLNGLICSSVLLAYGVLMNDALQLSLTISVSLLAVIIIASTLGIAIPLGLNKFKIDPALATGPFITTTNDLIGLGVYFFIGRVMYSLPL